MNALEEVSARYAHHDETVRQPRQFFDHRALCGIRSGQHGVQRRHDRHPQLAQQGEEVGASLAAEDPVLVLNGEHIHLIDVQEVGRAPIRIEVALGDLEPDTRRICVPSTASFIATTKTSQSGCAAANPSARWVVNVAMPQCRGRWFPRIANRFIRFGRITASATQRSSWNAENAGRRSRRGRLIVPATLTDGCSLLHRANTLRCAPEVAASNRASAVHK